MKLPQTLIIESADTNICFKKALQLAKDNLCLTPNNKKEACLECKSCLNIEKNNHPDLIIIERPADKKNISVELVREKFITRINSTPLISPFIIIIIKDAHTLSIGAQNALLKTLEEPPTYVKIILTVNNADNLLDTIKSRSQIKKIKSQIKTSENSKFREIIEMDLNERFKLVKEITEKEKKEGRKDFFYTLQFLDDLICELRVILKNYLNNSKLRNTIIKDLDKILDDRQKILYNTNKLLVLENIMLQTLDKEIYSKVLKNL